MKLGRAIKLVRTQRGLKQSDLAARASISVSYLSLIERDKRDPTYSTVEGLADALAIPVTALVYLAAERGEIEGISPELAEKLSHVILGLINDDSDPSACLSA